MTSLSDRSVNRLRAIAGDATGSEHRYTLLEVLGEGGMGTVYRGHDELLDREVAIKVVRAVAGPGSTALAERLRAEARVLASLEHPGIVPVHDAGVLPDGRAFHVMKRVQGETLETALDRIPELDRRLGILERVADAVAFAHRRGVVHRDLKPGNVMIGDFGEVLVLDWGVAKVLGTTDGEPGPAGASAPGVTNPGVVMGTPGFMAPEQIAAVAVDQRADVYALGALLAFLAGDPPKQAGADGSGNTAVRALPRPLRAIAERCLARAPHDRYPDAAEVAEEIRRFRAGARVRAYPERWGERLARGIRIYRTPILLVLAYLVMRVLVALFTR